MLAIPTKTGLQSGGGGGSILHSIAPIRRTSMKRAGSIAVLLFFVTAAPAADPGYKVTKKFKIGGEGGWDYLTMDSDARRLYITRFNRVTVMDADEGKVVGEIPGTTGVHGVALVPES